MGKIEKCEDIVAWQKAMDLCTEVYKVTNQKNFSADFILRDQIRKSVVSIPSNISEGFERGNNRQFLYFLTISKGSAGELRTQLQIAFNLNYIDKEQFDLLYNLVNDLSKLQSKFINYLKQNQENKTKH